jgi:hypothetical protein
MRKLFLTVLLAASILHAQKLQLATQANPAVTGVGNNGQVLISDGVSGFVPGDPIVSFNYANLLSARPATGTVTGSPARLSTFGASGTLYVTFASITGSGTSCTVQLKNVDSLGNAINSGSPISVTPANGTSSAAITPVLALQTAAQMSAIYACSAYPSAGTITVDFVPAISVGIAGTVKVDGSGVTQPVSGTVSISNFPATQPVSGSVSVSNFPATQPVSGTVTANAGTGTMAVSAASLPLPSGAATSAKQPALGIAGTPSTDVLSIQGAAGMTAVKVDGSAVTQPVSGTVTANAAQSGTWTVQPGNTANTTAWKVDGSGVTQPVSGTVTANAGTGTMAVSAASLPLPSGAATSANQSTVKAASTQAASTDTSSVVQINPNQPALTTPLNIQGALTNNNAAPGATNIGTLDALANAAPPSFTEGNQTKLSIDLKGNLRVNNHPPDVLGCYMVNGRTGTYGGLAASTPLFSMRWGDATHLAVIQSVKINVATTTAATAATQAERELVIARSFTVSDSGGTAVTLTGNNQKMRTSQATSLVTDMRFGQPLTAGTRTLDANPLSSVVSFLALNMTGMDIGCGSGGPFTAGTAWTCVGGLGMVTLLDVATGDYPIVLAQNEGIIVRIGKDAQPTTAVQQTYVSVKWCEVNAF